MCGRTALTAAPEDLCELFGLDELPDVLPHYNVPPSSPLEVLRVVFGASGRKLEPMRWGLVPVWAKQAAIGHKLTLARAETAATTGAFRDALRRRRCLVAVDGFFEWRREGNAASVPFFIRRPDHKPFALAALWSRWVSKDGEVIESCAILTQAARPPVDVIHDRMPLVLEREAWDRWLDPNLIEPDAVAPMLAPRTPELIAYPVSTYVNDPRHDDSRCVAPSEPAQRRLPFES